MAGKPLPREVEAAAELAAVIVGGLWPAPSGAFGPIALEARIRAAFAEHPAFALRLGFEAENIHADAASLAAEITALAADDGAGSLGPRETFARTLRDALTFQPSTEARGPCDA